MSPSPPTNTKTRSPSTPYPRRSPTHPKSSRQQFSACGACRMRRVRCDLKDLAPDPAGPQSACSNCRERGLKCVDEFADVKTVKLLRRGRRLQQVEAIYGRMNGSDLASPQIPQRPPSIIPQLQPEFFLSSFWRRFRVQRPIIDPAEFPARFQAHSNGTQPLSPEGRLISSLLVIWAASFGVDERGAEESDSDQDTSSDSAQTPQDAGRSYRDRTPDRRRRERKERTDAMVREVLQLVDSYSIMRKPSWDGVRVLLLLLPLMEDGQPPLEILTTYEATLAQIHALASPALVTPTISHPSGSSSIHTYTSDALVKARIFWYAYVHEGITTGLRGGRLVLDEVDLEMFQNTLPTFGNSLTNSLPSPASSTFPSPSSVLPLSSHHQTPVSHLQQQPTLQHHHQPSRAHPQQYQQSAIQQTFLLTAHLFSLPLHLSAICRKVHTVLTGRDARHRAERGLAIDSDGVQEVWDALDKCWDEFDSIRRSAIAIAREEVERYVGSWQIFIFECQNIVRDALKQHIISHSSTGGSPSHVSFPPHPTPPPSSAPSPHRLHTLAMRRCARLLPHVLRIIKLHLNADGAGSELFKWDTGLVGDGCFFAGFLAAGGGRDQGACTDDVDGFMECSFKQEDTDSGLSQNEGVEVCLRALREMRWAFAKAEEREQTIRMVWQARRTRHSLVREYPGHDSLGLDDTYHHELHAHQQHHQQTSYAPTVLPLISHRPLLPPLTLTLPPRETLIAAPGTTSAPHTGGTDGSANGWPTYTPPGTGTSGSGSTGLSATSGSPVYSGMPSAHMLFQKGGEIGAGDSFYQTHAGVEMDQFSFSVPVSGYHHRTQGQGIQSNGSFLDSGVVFGTTGSSIVDTRLHTASDDGSGCSQFGEDCAVFYH